MGQPVTEPHGSLGGGGGGLQPARICPLYVCFAVFPRHARGLFLPEQQAVAPYLYPALQNWRAMQEEGGVFVPRGGALRLTPAPKWNLPSTRGKDSGHRRRCDANPVAPSPARCPTTPTSQSGLHTQMNRSVRSGVGTNSPAPLSSASCPLSLPRLTDHSPAMGA